MALLLLDAHTDTWDHYYGERYFHGTPFRRAVEEGLLLPERSLMAGMRGSLYSPGDWAEARSLGFELMVGRDLATLTPKEFATAVSVRVGDAPVFLSFDIDFVDPAFAPGTGTPEVGGPSSARRAGARACAGRNVFLRLRRRRTVAALRLERADHGAAGGQHRLRVHVAGGARQARWLTRGAALPTFRCRCREQIRMFAHKWRHYERNSFPWRRARLRWHFLRRDSYLRFPVQGNLLEALDEGRAEIGPWVLIEPGCWFSLHPDDGDALDRRGNDRQHGLHAGGDRPDRDRQVTACSPTTAS